MAKYCASCNSLLENDEIKFCPSCGSAQFVPADQPVSERPPVMPQVNNDFAKEPKKKSGFKKIILAVVALCVVIAIVLNFSSILGKIKQTFGSAGSYFAYAEKESVEEFCDTFEEYYEKYFFDNVIRDSKHNLKMDIKLSDELLESLAGDAGESIEIDWLSNLSLDITLNSAASALSADMILGIDKQSVLTAALFSDAKNNELLLKLVEISDDVLRFNSENASLTNSGKFDRALLAKVLPKASVVKKLITKYHGIIVENIANVEKTSEELSVDDISEKLTVLKCALTEKDIKTISLAILKEVKDDKDIKSIYEDIENAVGGEDTYASFVEGINGSIEELSAEEAGDETVTVIYDYVNSDGEIVGRKIGENGEYLNYLTVQSGNKYAAFLNLEDGISVKEAGTKKGDRITGECIFAEGEETLYKISFTDYDEKASEKGKLDGKIRITPSSSALKEVAPDGYQKYAGLLDMAFDIDIKGNSEKGNFKLTVLNGEKALFEADTTYSVSAGKSVGKPDGKVIEVNGLDSLYEYIGNMHLDQLVNNLRKTSIPKEYVDAIEEISNQLKSNG